MPAHRERSSSGNYGRPALVTNGDYLTIREFENNLVLWMFEEGKRCSVTWIRNTERRRRACARTFRPIFSLLQVLEDGRAVTLDVVLVFHIEFAEESPAYRFIVLALFGFLSCRL